MPRAALLLTTVVAGACAALPATMRAVHVTGHCNASTGWSCVGASDGVAVPQAGVGQLLLAVGGSSVNPCDSDTVQGYPGCHIDAAGTPGGDVAGTVVAVGPGCSGRLRIGDRVWANRFSLAGGMAEYALAAEAQMGLMPSTLSFAEAGTVPIVGGTSLQCLQCLPAANANCSRASPPGGAAARPLAGLTVVITSGSGGTGFLGIQMAKALGAARVITAAHGAGPIAWMKDLGADVVTDYVEQPDIFAALAPDSVDAVYDNYGGNGTADRAMRALRVGGTYLLLPHGNSAGALSKHPKAGVRQINFGDVDNQRHDTLDQMKALFEASALKINVGAVPGIQQTFTFDDAAVAYTLTAGGNVLGKIAMVPTL